MINNHMCLSCDVSSICKVSTVLEKFSDEAKVNLGVDLEIKSCAHYISDNEE